VKFEKLELPGIVLVEPDVFRDDRGFFLETYNAKKHGDAGLPPFVQDNHSRSVQRTLRGLHSQFRQPQGKLVRAIEGEIFDVAVDVRRSSPTFGRWVGVVLSADNFRQLYVPPGFLHGFCVLSEVAQVEYKCTNFYDPGGELGVVWNDPTLRIDWPIQDPILSKKDASLPRLQEVIDRLPA
jgi:dTDP-4-dehydrorhamnose 3,5-epimerase